MQLCDHGRAHAIPALCFVWRGSAWIFACLDERPWQLTGDSTMSSSSLCHCVGIGCPCKLPGPGGIALWPGPCTADRLRAQELAHHGWSVDLIRNDNPLMAQLQEMLAVRCHRWSAGGPCIIATSSVLSWDHKQ